jgi:hypothetical protein
VNVEEEGMLAQASGLLHAIEPHHHEHIGRLLDVLRRDAEGRDPQALDESWARFDRELQAHLRDEETYILPAFSQAHPDESRAILIDHAQIRRLAGEIALELARHAVSARTLEALRERLRAHATEEDAVMYPWAASQLV